MAPLEAIYRGIAVTLPGPSDCYWGRRPQARAVRLPRLWLRFDACHTPVTEHEEGWTIRAGLAYPQIVVTRMCASEILGP